MIHMDHMIWSILIQFSRRIKERIFHPNYENFIEKLGATTDTKFTFKGRYFPLIHGETFDICLLRRLFKLMPT